MTAYACYRLPFANSYTKVIQTVGEPMVLRSFDEFKGRSGFVIAPFAVSDDCPIVVIEGDATHHNITDTQQGDNSSIAPKHSTISESYSNTFSSVHSRLVAGDFRKMVLARVSVEDAPEGIDADALFHRACTLYPRMFVALVSTPQTGTWLVATPETLLEGINGEWRTMALAGTMTLEGEQLEFDNPPTGGRVVSDDIRWSDKNISEQRYVATYINDCLTRFATDITEDGPYTTRAGNLVHLRSDFSFRLSDNSVAGRLIAALHPTPAVCGLPKDETYRYIIENEPAPRRYYSGFMGPLDADGDTHLYVSLRCMELADGQYRLHAGGGLLKDSRMEQEWEETEAKMQTMRRLISQGRDVRFSHPKDNK